MDKVLLQRYVEGNVTSKEVEKVVDWLDADEANVREFMALHKLYDFSLFNQAEVRKPKVSSGRSIFFRKTSYDILKIAAAILIIWGITSLFFMKKTEQPVFYQTFIVPAGQRAELILPDSTKVWLNSKTEIIYPTHFGNDNREVKLNGEAYFKVKKDPDNPFIVKTGQMDIQVLGTEFNVMAYLDRDFTEVSLLEGSVQLTASGISRPYILLPNERALLKGGKLHVSPILRFDYFRWKEGLLSFQDESVQSIMNKLELYFDVRIDVRRTSLLDYQYTGKFRVDDGVEQVLKVLQHEHQFIYTRDRERNIITIK